jgi:hypothetical protein
VEVDKTVGCEGRVKRDAQKTTLASRINLARDVEERGKHPIISGYKYSTRLLGYEKPAVGSKLHVRGVRQAAYHLRVGEALR